MLLFQRTEDLLFSLLLFFSLVSKDYCLVSTVVPKLNQVGWLNASFKSWQKAHHLSVLTSPVFLFVPRNKTIGNIFLCEACAERF